MKMTKVEKVWVFFVVLFYVLYNFPGVPPYYEAVPTIIHALLTVVPLWITVYIGLAKVYKTYKLRDDKENKEEQEG